MTKYRRKPINDPRKDWITVDFGGIRGIDYIYSPVRNEPDVFEAVQFDPQQQPWPAGIIPWGDIRPRDMSWGFIDTPGGREHVQASDWIATGPAGEYHLFKTKMFEKTYEPAE